MPSEAVSLLLATMFTAGCIAISKMERHADQVSELLGAVFFVIAAFAVMAAVAQASGTADVLASSFREQVKLSDRLPAAVE